MLRRLYFLTFLAFILPTYAQVEITEFLASNGSGLEDEDGDDEDWIELKNTSASAVDLDGWSLTDDDSISQKWVFPSVTLQAGEFLVVFASGKDRTIPGLTLHTNFSLKKGGEYLALYKPGGSVIATEFAPEYPPQATDVSYGQEDGIAEETVINLGTTGRAGVPTSQANFNSQFNNWNTSLTGTFTGSSWQGVALGIGYEESGAANYGTWIGVGGDLETRMFGNNASAFLRIPFTLANASEITSASLRMRWDDGFVAYLNGAQVAADRNPATLSWNTSATGNRLDALNEDQVYYNIDLLAAPLNEGNNLLAFHGLNQSTTSSDFLLQPELVLTRVTGTGSSSNAYFTSPSPGAPNGLGEQELAPIFENVTESALTQPTGTGGSTALLVTAEVREGSDDIATVKAFYRTMFGSEISVTLVDTGGGVDALADDGIYSGEIPTSQVGSGQMLRWRFEATDVNSNSRTAPAFSDPLDSDQYYGTVAIDSDLDTSQLPVLQTFVANASAVDTRAGDRVSLYYLGEFYDNIQMDLHGQSTAGFPKKSYDLDFNKGNRFRWKTGEDKVKDINLLTNWADKSKVRNTLAYEQYALAGHEYHFAFPTRVERNGSFFSVVDMVEDGDDRYLERLDMDPDGALYKMYDKMVDPNVAAKKTRKEEGVQDLQDFYDQMDDTLSNSVRRRNVYDYTNLAAYVNHLAANQVIGITDTGHKNYYLYRDTEGTGEWQPLPWDVDLSAGHHWGGSVIRYFDDNLNTGLKWFNSNPVWQLMYDESDFKKMIARRFETLRRDLYQANSVAPAQDWVRNKIIDIEKTTNPDRVATTDSDLDYTTWGSWGDNLSSFPYSQRIYNDWLPAHRNVIFGSSASVRGQAIPPTQPSLPNIDINSVDYNPSSGTQEDEYIILQNFENSTIDLSGWTLSGAVEFTFRAGTVILDGNGNSGSQYRGLIHVAKSPADFRSRSTGPTGGEYRFVVGPYQKQLSARGETIFLHNADGQLIDQFTYAGAPTPTQVALRVTEINYHPSDPTAAEILAQPGLQDDDFEFIELMHIGTGTLDLSGATFSEGIDYTFPASTTLTMSSRLILAKNPTAFALRYGSLGIPVYGPFSGRLDNSGETLQLRDSVGETILDFRYEDSWYPDSDGNGSSLVLRDTATSYDAYSAPSTWGSSPEFSGTPGFPGSGYRTHFNGWQASNYTEADMLPGMPGHPNSDTDNDLLETWAEYALGTDPEVPNPFPAVMGSTGIGDAKRFGFTVTRRRFTSDVEWQLLASNILSGFAPVSIIAETDQTTLSTEQESVLIYHADPDVNYYDTQPENFFQLQMTPKASVSP